MFFFCAVVISKSNLSSLRWALSSLAVVGFLGVLLRYKIAFPLPWIHQKHLLHAHSHFAFNGWISQVLMILIVLVVEQIEGISLFSRYKKLFVANLVFSYGMLISFSLKGYWAISITISTLSILLSYLFGYLIIKRIQLIQRFNLSFLFFKAAILFNVISSIGVFSLAYLMMNRVADQNWYLATVYFFLHFQYNGWFIFALLGILIYFIESRGIKIKHGRIIFYLSFLSLIPAYLLSTIWADLPAMVYVLAIVAAIVQCIAWGILVYQIIQHHFVFHQKNYMRLTIYLIVVSLSAFTFKFLLQLFSTVPVLGQFAFGIRPIVIAYLHLVLILGITSSILAMLYECGVLGYTSFTSFAVSVFIIGAILNEILLMAQGVSYITPYNIGVQNETLFAVAIIMFLGALFVAISSHQNQTKST